MGLGKFTMRCDQGATLHVQGRWRAPLIDLNSGDPVLDFEGNLQAGQPISLYGYTGRMHVRKTISATAFDLELTSSNQGVRIPQTIAFFIGWCRLATEANHPLTGLAPVDGVTPAAGDRILVKSQTNAGDNGVYVATATGPWTRPLDADVPADISEGCCVWVREGVRYDDTTWRQSQALSTFSDAQTWQRNEDIGVFEVYATPAQTAGLTASGVYDVEMVAPGTGEVTRVLEGKFRLSKEVTRTG